MAGPIIQIEPVTLFDNFYLAVRPSILEEGFLGIQNLQLICSLSSAYYYRNIQRVFLWLLLLFCFKPKDVQTQVETGSRYCYIH